MAAGEHLCGRRKTFLCGSRGAFCAVAGKHFFVSRGAFVRQKGSILWQQESICLAEEELFCGHRGAFVRQKGSILLLQHCLKWLKFHFFELENSRLFAEF